ncbi:MAG: hypothetical protein LIO86_02330 [Lachnospiraceae bacterium]|nr:hypothetical protein [Lachnospiraceae bacterium]
MGIFSKKTAVCRQCGREYQKGFFDSDLCPECEKEQEQNRNEIERLKEEVPGYVAYRKAAYLPELTFSELQDVVIHRDGILEKYRRLNDGIDREALEYAGDNFRKLSEEEILNVILMTDERLLDDYTGASFNDYFFIPNGFDQLIVDAQDVFAVGYTTYKGESINGSEIILCAVFTNDPYIPAFPVVFTGKKKFMEIGKSAAGRQAAEELFESNCPNLTYPVCDLKELKNQIGAENEIRGNIDRKTMLKMISDAQSCITIFNLKRMDSVIPESSELWIEEYGYMGEAYFHDALHLDRRANQNFWDKKTRMYLVE